MSYYPKSRKGNTVSMPEEIVSHRRQTEKKNVRSQRIHHRPQPESKFMPDPGELAEMKELKAVKIRL